MDSLGARVEIGGSCRSDFEYDAHRATQCGRQRSRGILFAETRDMRFGQSEMISPLLLLSFWMREGDK